MGSEEKIRTDGLAPWIGAAVFLLTAGLCIALAAPTAHWLDSAEFAAASFELGNAHPPGHPLAILLGKAMTLLPVGSIAFRVNCASAVALGVAAVLLLFMIRRVAVQAWAWLRPEAESPAAAILWPVSAAGALGFALCYASLYQGVRAEVYGLNLALNLGVAHLTLRYLISPRARDLVAAGLLLGLGLCNHHLLTLAVLPAGLVAVALLRERPWKTRATHVGCALLAALLGLSVLVQLPVRSVRAPLINWGAPHTAERFAWTVSAKLFTRTAERSIKSKPSNRVTALASATSAELSPGILVAALAGLVLLGLRRRLIPLAALIGLAILGNAAAAVLAGFEPDNPDSLGYVLLLLALLSVLAAVAIIVALSYLRRRVPWRLATVVLAAGVGFWPVMMLAGAFHQADLRQAYGAEETAGFLLDAPPPGGVLLTSYYQTGFGVWAARVMDGARPDVDHVHRSYLSQPGYVANLLKRQPRLQPLIHGLKRPGALDYARLRKVAGSRTVLFEFDDDTYGSDMIRLSSPQGPLYRVLSSPRRFTAAQAAASQHQWQRLAARLHTTTDDPLTRMYLLWARYLRARYHVLRGECPAARPSWERARKLGNPKDPALVAIARHCGFQ